MKYATGVIIGRFQPFHHGHHAILKQALEVSGTVVVVLGSACSARSTRNPFTLGERQALIEANLTPVERERVKFVGVRDYFYNNAAWTGEVSEKVESVSHENGPVALFGFDKDASSDYLKWFPDWAFESAMAEATVSATPIREAFLRDASSADREKALSTESNAWMQSFASTPAYARLRDEQTAIDDHRREWASSPYPPTFVTTDAIVIQAGHILLIKRKGTPGNGLWAIPGGFLNSDEWLKDCAIRELIEETEIEIDKETLRKALVEVRAFDHPLRSSRGRTITHAHYFKLHGDRLAKIHGGDDAAEAKWVPVLDLAKMEEQFFEDHFQIVQSLVRNY